MFASAFTAITAFEVILFRKHNIAFRTVVKIFRFKLFVKHNSLKDKEVMPIVITMQSKRQIIIYKGNASIAVV